MIARAEWNERARLIPDCVLAYDPRGLAAFEGIDYHERLGSLQRSTRVIEVQHLTKRYGRVTAVDDVTFRVERGEILGFLGPNGAGKTTTMRVLTGYMPATSGPRDRRGLRRVRAAARGQAPDRLPAGDAAALPRDDRPRVPGLRRPDQGRPLGRAQGAAWTRPMEKTRVTDMAARHCGKLSKGYRQRVGLAQALLHNPDVLILDEPTAGLDPKQIIETRELIKAARRRSHDHPEHAHPARGLADLPARGDHQPRPGGRGRTRPRT